MMLLMMKVESRPQDHELHKDGEKDETKWAARGRASSFPTNLSIINYATRKRERKKERFN